MAWWCSCCQALLTVVILIMFVSMQYTVAVVVRVVEVRRCPVECTCFNDYTKVVCGILDKYQVLSDIPPTARVLAVRSGHLPYIPANSFKSLLNLRSLSLEHVSLESLHASALAGLGNLRHLSLSHNELTVVDGKALEQLTSLRELQLSHNSIEGFVQENGILLKDLTLLTLSHNKIHTLNNYTFEYLQSLQELHLDHNRIRIISLRAFEGLTALHTLNLSHCQLNHLQESRFSTLENLHVLDLSYNNITKLSGDVFIGLQSLVTLLLHHNQIKNINSNTFVHLTNIQVINMDANPLHSVGRAFNVPTLKQLSISAGHSLQITNVTFSGLAKLHFLNLSAALLDTMGTTHSRSFAHLHHLDTIDLSSNNLTSLEEEYFQNATAIRNIYLQKNLWHCNCTTLSWISHLPTSQTMMHSFQCTTPYTFYGINAVRVYYEALKCDPEWVTTNQDDYTSAMSRVSSSAILQCLPALFHHSTTVWTNEGTGVVHSYKYNDSRPTLNESNAGLAILDVIESGQSSPYQSELDHDERIKVLDTGDLFIAYTLRSDAGIYTCMRYSPEANVSETVVLRLNYDVIVYVKSLGCLIGWCCAFAVLLISMFVTCVTDRSLRRCKSKEEDEKSRKARHLRQMLVDLEAYHNEQMYRLRSHYANHLQRLKDQCSMQAAKISDNYTQQVDRAKNYKEDKIYNLRQYKEGKIHALRDYRDSKIDAWRDYKESWRDYRDAKRDAWQDYKDSWRDYKDAKIDHMRDVRDNYTNQVTKLRESVRQQHFRAQEGYHQQILKVRDYCTQQLKKFAVTYKLKQKHISTLMGNFTSIDSCRTLNARTESILFDPEICLENIFATSLTSKLPDELSFLNMPGDDTFMDGDDDVSGDQHGSQDECSNKEFERRSSDHNLNSSDTECTESVTNCQVHTAPTPTAEQLQATACIDDDDGRCSTDMDFVSAASDIASTDSNTNADFQHASDIPFADEEESDNGSIYDDTISMISSNLETEGNNASGTAAATKDDHQQASSTTPLVLQVTNL